MCEASETDNERVLHALMEAADEIRFAIATIMSNKGRSLEVWNKAELLARIGHAAKEAGKLVQAGAP